MITEADENEPFRICLDLNVWCAAVLSQSRGRSGSATQFLVDTVRSGRSAFGPTQLVISWGMLDRLSRVLARRLSLDLGAIQAITAEIALLAQIGPAELSPLMILGGTGVQPLRDEEDAHVLEVAVAGRAEVLATANFDDFISYHTTIIEPRRIALHRTFGHQLVIAHPEVVAQWLRQGEIRLG